MKVEQFTYLLEKPLLLGEEHVNQLNEIIKAYPFFQSAHLLYTKALNNTNHFTFHSTLKKTAVIAGDRKVLYELIKLKQEDISIDSSIKTESEIKIELESSQKDKEAKESLNDIALLDNIRLLSETSLNEKENVVFSFEIEATEETTEKNIPNEEIPQNTISIAPLDMHDDAKTIDDVIENQVANAYIEKEVLKITEIEKGKRKEEVELKPQTKQKIDANEPHSFSEWLNAMREGKVLEHENEIKPVVQEQVKQPETPKKPDRALQNKLINDLITKEPRISKLNTEKTFYSAVDTARSSVLEDEALVTETLAKIYALQANYSKAIRAYEILSLKFPEKSVYFASLIQEIKNKLK